MNKITIIMVLCVMALFLLAGCQIEKSQEPTPNTVTEQQLPETVFQLTFYNNCTGKEEELKEVVSPPGYTRLEGIQPFGILVEKTGYNENNLKEKYWIVTNNSCETFISGDFREFVVCSGKAQPNEYWNEPSGIHRVDRNSSIYLQPRSCLYKTEIFNNATCYSTTTTKELPIQYIVQYYNYTRIGELKTKIANLTYNDTTLSANGIILDCYATNGEQIIKNR